MTEKVSKAHPFVLVDDERKKYPICETRTGYNCKSKHCRVTGLKEMGPGITIYFKYVKYMTVLFLIMSFVTLPHLVFFVGAGTKEYQRSKTISSFFGITTLGNLGAAERFCSNGSNTETVGLYCKSGNLESIYILGKQQADGSSTCDDDGNKLRVDSSCDYTNSFTDVERNSTNSQFNEK